MKEQARNMATTPEMVRPLTSPPDKPDMVLECLDGEWKQALPMREPADLLADLLVSELNAFAGSARRGFGVRGVDLRLPTGVTRRPDVCFFSPEDWSRAAFGERSHVVDAVPVLAAHMERPATLFDEMVRSVQEYFLAGVRLAWWIYPRHRSVYVFESAEAVRILSEEHELDGRTVLPGFRLALTSLFGASGNASCGRLAE